MDLLLRNAFVYTGDAHQSGIPCGALHISQGRIVWIGADAECPALPGARELDLGGRVVIPGLVNTHAHGGLSLYRGIGDEGDLFHWARTLAPRTSTLTLEDNHRGCQVAVMEMVRNGITTACDCTRYGAGIFSEVASAIGMRSLSGALASSPQLRPAGRQNWPLALEETERALAERGRDPLCRFYLGAHSPYSCMPELIQDIHHAARERGLPFVIHVAENRQEVEIVRERHGCRPIEWLHRLGVLDAHTLLAHGVWLEEHEIEILAATGAAVSHNPTSNAKLASGVAPVPALRRKGVPVGLGTDSMLSNNGQDLFQEMRMSVMLQRAHMLDGHALSARDALAMATLEGARAIGWQREIGSLEVGKEADLVVLDLWHPLGLTLERVRSDLVYRAGPQHVRTVMVHGEIVYHDGRFTRVDEAEIRRAIERHCESHLSPLT
jgi:5-methylthioadenosine/S-adenosylhomocysteine deaminase